MSTKTCIDNRREAAAEYDREEAAEHTSQGAMGMSMQRAAAAAQDRTAPRTMRSRSTCTVSLCRACCCCFCFMSDAAWALSFCVGDGANSALATDVGAGLPARGVEPFRRARCALPVDATCGVFGICRSLGLLGMKVSMRSFTRWVAVRHMRSGVPPPTNRPQPLAAVKSAASVSACVTCSDRAESNCTCDVGVRGEG